MKKGQVAIEFLVIIGIMSLAVIPILFAMHWNSSNSPDRLAISKGTFSVARIAASINSVGSIGEGAKIRAQVELPACKSLKIKRREVALVVETSYGDVVILHPTDYDADGIELEGVRTEGGYIMDVYSDEPGEVKVELVE